MRRILRVAILFFCLGGVAPLLVHAREPVDQDTEQGSYDNPLDPRAEGIYAITLRCKSGDRQCRDIFTDVDRLTVIDSRSSYGVFLTFATAIRKDFFDNFFLSKVSADGLSVNATPRIGSMVNRFSFVSVVADPAAGRLTGEVLDARNGVYYELRGRLLAGLASLHSDYRSIPFSEISGVYEGSMGAMEGRLTIIERPDHQIVGSFVSKKTSSGAPVFRVDFTAGTWEPDKGLLRLIFTNPRFFSLCEFALSLDSLHDSTTTLSGHEFCNFALNSLNFHR